MIVPCKTIEKLLQSVLAFPRRVKLVEEKNAIVFKADNGSRLYIARVDFDRERSKGDLPYRTKFFLNAIKTEKGKQDYCESVNYGKPDWRKPTVETQ